MTEFVVGKEKGRRIAPAALVFLEEA